ncbi:restriction endonuclease subunit S [Ligilactobacillus murinus]|uniref:restriction endonuclease subunit S n=1 Tax=Ligilactobacillus murinus TaxID=1622 RepID=UPI00214C9422|nr:restriction endonuclease subunit S [Ligilactobacillus murinus]MCR1881552.1 restriction endonuclease subunit S [Ligilactobacillus murinus]
MAEEKKNIPKLRFREFTGDNANAWELRKLGNISKTKRGLTYKPSNIDNTGIRVLRSSNIKEDTFVISDDDVFVKESAVNIPFVENGDILITAANGSTNLVGKHAIIRDIPKNSAVHGGFMLITTSKEYEFLNALMSSNWYKKFIKKYVVGGNGAIGNLRKNDLDNQKIYVPKKDEQKKIGNFFKMLDSLITLHQRMLDEYKTLKKTMLSKMFPKNSEKYPELRFSGFTDAWELRKLGNISKTKRGLTYKPSNIDNTGIRVLRSSNIKEDTFVISDDDVFVKESAVNIPFVENGDILITAANGSTNLVGKHAIIRDIPKNSAVHGGFMLITTSKEYEFLNALMSSNWYKKFIKKYVVGGNGAIGNLRKNDLDNQKIYVPKKDEQKKIGNFFKMLDSLITLHQRELELLKTLKKTMLQQMFV